MEIEEEEEEGGMMGGADLGAMLQGMSGPDAQVIVRSSYPSSPVAWHLDHPASR